MTFKRMSFFFRSNLLRVVNLGAISSYSLQSFFVSLEKNETKKGFPLLSGLGCSVTKDSKHYSCFKSNVSEILIYLRLVLCGS